MANGYPTGPCDKPYDPGIQFQTATLAMIKNLADQNGIQIEFTFKPTEFKMRFIKKIGSSVKKRDITLSNDELKTKFDYNRVCGLIYDISIQ